MLGFLQTRLVASLNFASNSTSNSAPKFSKKPSYSMLLTILFVTLAASVGFAAYAVKPIQFKVDHFQTANVVPVNEDGVPTNKAKVSKKDVEKILTVFRGVNEIAKNLRVPEQIGLEMSEIEFSPRADAMNNVIYMGVRFGAKDDKDRIYTQHPGAMIPVAAHEYGHIVFAQNVLSEVQIYKDALGLLAQMAKLAAAFESIQAHALVLAEKYESASPEEKQRILAKLEELKEQASRINELGLELNNALGPLFAWVNAATTPYNEFFADILAILYTEKPESVFKAVQTVMPNGVPGINRKIRDDAESRSFKGAGLVHVHGRSPHSVFKPTREFIWKKYLQRPMIMRNHKSAVAEAVARVMTAELLWLQDHFEVNPMKDQVFVNKRLMKQLDAELSKIAQ